ncbi:hypothetical protein HYE66_10440 [Aggregatibacter actinomycetemcomitans]|nr:hypothetical protein [Aggregatibacter actinomycetemcomitans]
MKKQSSDLSLAQYNRIKLHAIGANHVEYGAKLINDAFLTTEGAKVRWKITVFFPPQNEKIR